MYVMNIFSNLLMLGLHRIPEGLGTDLRPKNGQTLELVRKVVCSSYVTHQNVTPEYTQKLGPTHH